jgi:hypothetical protein
MIVIVHRGALNSGHYQTYARVGGGSDWYRFSDAIVEKVSSEDAIQKNFGADLDENDPDTVDERYKIFNAVMLVYVKAAAWDDVYLRSAEVEIPQAVRDDLANAKVRAQTGLELKKQARFSATRQQTRPLQSFPIGPPRTPPRALPPPNFNGRNFRSCVCVPITAPVARMLPSPIAPGVKTLTIQFHPSPSHHVKEAVTLGTDNTLFDFHDFLASLPCDWEGEFTPCTKQLPVDPSDDRDAEPLRYCRKLLVKNADKVLVFTIRLEKAFAHPVIIAGRQGQAICADIWPAVGKALYVIGLDNEHGELIKKISRHPYNVLARKINTKKQKFDMSQSIHDFFSGDVADFLKNRQDREQAIHDFLGGLAALRGSDYVRVELSDQPNVKAHRICGDNFLFRLVWVFRWAVPLLESRPNCLCGDGTFRIGAPYTTMLISAVFSNEAIPIAFCMAPSENSEAFRKIYDRTIKALKICYKSPSLMTKLPLVSDQGAGLSKFTKENKVPWRLCHFHLLRAVGTKTRIAQCVRRLLRCCSEEEYVEVKADIEMEIQMHYTIPKRKPPDHPMKVLRMMLGKEKEEWPYLKEHWARYMRPGCPTTTAHKESINHQLNKKKGEDRAFINGLKKLVSYSRSRFKNRNSNDRKRHRASNLFLDKLAGAEGDAIRQNAAKLKFLTELNSFVGGQPQRNWEFPVYKGKLPEFDATQPKIGSEPFPEGWRPSPPRAEEEEEDDETGKAMPPPKKGTKGESTKDYRRDLIWDIIHAIRTMLPTATWNRDHEHIISNVHHIVKENVKIPKDQPIPRELAVAWRLQCYLEAGVPD